MPVSSVTSTLMSEPVQSLCAGPSGNVPLGDYLLAQKVWLETNEEDFVKTANKTKL